MMGHKQLEVYAIGTEVLVGGDIPAKILRLEIAENDLVRYECTWWDDRTRKIEWFNSSELKATKPISATRNVRFLGI